MLCKKTLTSPHSGFPTSLLRNVSLPSQAGGGTETIPSPSYSPLYISPAPHRKQRKNKKKKQVFYIKRMCAQRGALQKVTQMCCWGGAALGSSHLTLQPCHLLHQLRLKSLRKCRKQRRRQFLLSALLVLDLQSHTHRHTLWHQWQSLFSSNLFFFFTFLYCWTDSEIISGVWSPDSGSVRPAWRVECPEFQPWWSITSCRPPDLHTSYT